MITRNFLVTALIVVLIPGTGVIYIISTGVTLGGVQASLPRSPVRLGSSRISWPPS